MILERGLVLSVVPAHLVAPERRSVKPTVLVYRGPNLHSA